MSEPNDQRDETVPASAERHEIHDSRDESPVITSGPHAAPIDFDAYE
jgi:hypothetical protein